MRHHSLEVPALWSELFVQYARTNGPLAQAEKIFPLSTDPWIELPDGYSEFASFNCQLHVHMVWDHLFELGYLASPIPKCFRSKEIALSEQHFEHITLDAPDDWQIGDVLLSAQNESVAPELFHLAILVGHESGKPVFSHTLSLADTSKSAIVFWTLDDFVRSKYHASILGVRRPKTPIRFSASEEVLFWRLCDSEDDSAWNELFSSWAGALQAI